MPLVWRVPDFATPEDIAEHTAGHPELLAVCVRGSAIDDACVKVLATHCSNLRVLDVRLSGVSDRAITAVAQGCPQLEHLYVRCPDVSDVSVTAVAHGCPQLQQLELSDTNVSDVSITQRCPNLHHLDLRSTEATDGVGVGARVRRSCQMGSRWRGERGGRVAASRRRRATCAARRSTLSSCPAVVHVFAAPACLAEGLATFLLSVIGNTAGQRRVQPQSTRDEERDERPAPQHHQPCSLSRTRRRRLAL
mmetsp:Transcript_53657/g.165024  ORF Transcript_53657/g.165024 Transcript_53657/m.165024 type:complete len:250 (+) Transcript_53657:62-811(+)|eukprot:CAMPEP_0174833624 /NCGR_PEP_ID=MMETSP1114-20130205/4352_1 /TAXON_ID=312471 /ORGANISM="Neobodo designis, Strain CCAP 1951/1" /LENGTH=249 /DNA_ID=CAMNT_0016067515 /DNA_START=62 /DNA_END=811 /DNA_ORIENTATION=-